MPLLFALTECELVKQASMIIDPRDGAHVVFTGTVRGFNKSKLVNYLFYEAYENLACSQFAKLEEEARLRFGISKALAVHRLGIAKIGECAVMIRASAPHRHEAFLAARFLIDELKKSIPIWKQEHYADGTSTWDKGLCQCDESFDPERDPALDPVKKAYESQNLDFNIILQARVLLIGAGGLGCPLAVNLAALGIGHLEIYDGDYVQATNLARQFVFTRNDRGHNKAILIKNYLEARFSWTKVLAHKEFMTKSQAQACVPTFDLVIDGSDCMKTKTMMAEITRQARIPYLCASVSSEEGEIALITPGAEGGCFCCWRQNFKQPPTCAQSGVLTHVCALTAAYAAAQAQLMLAAPKKILQNRLMLISTQKFYENLAITRDPHCHACGPRDLLRVF